MAGAEGILDTRGTGELPPEGRPMRRKPIKGAIGVNLGRNVWQHPHPVAMMKALNGVIYANATPEEAFELFETSRQPGKAE